MQTSRSRRTTAGHFQSVKAKKSFLIAREWKFCCSMLIRFIWPLIRIHHRLVVRFSKDSYGSVIFSRFAKEQSKRDK